MGIRERKAEFLKTAPYRINMVVKWVDSLIECSDTTQYHYTERHIEMMTEHLEAALGRLKESYKRSIKLSKPIPFYFNGSDPIQTTTLDNEPEDYCRHCNHHSTKLSK
tara:strand:+ start:127 stop:450 length:324 start_codon:yes stop_codon:yes gene_type:complete